MEHLILNKDSNCSINYFFCKYDEATSLLAREIIGSLARQMFGEIPINSFSDLDTSIGDFNLNTQQILSHMLLRLPHYKYYILVIDGLDECESGEVKHLIELLRSLLASSEQGIQGVLHWPFRLCRWSLGSLPTRLSCTYFAVQQWP